MRADFVLRMPVQSRYFTVRRPLMAPYGESPSFSQCSLSDMPQWHNNVATLASR